MYLEIDLNLIKKFKQVYILLSNEVRWRFDKVTVTLIRSLLMVRLLFPFFA